MRRPYEAHEIRYRKMQAEGILAWGQRRPGGSGSIDPATRRFLIDVLAQTWAPKKGKLIELGCGTAPLLRWFRKRGFSGLGVDVSKTAIAMARLQSRGLKLRFRRADLCTFRCGQEGTFDLAVDGHCLHCITRREDRKAFLATVRRLLRPGGLFIVNTMCTPLDRGLFSRKYERLKLLDRICYARFPGGRGYQGARAIGGVVHVPTRYFAHWRAILAEVRAAGFEHRLFRVSYPTPELPNSDVSIAALAAS